MSVGEIVPATISNQVQYLNKGFEVENFANRVQNKDCVSVSSSSSSSSTLPNDEDEKKVAKPTKSRICIDSSNDVVIGPVTQIHGPITIHQALQQITNDGEKDDADGKLPDKSNKRSYYGIGVIIILLAILVTIVSFVNVWKHTEIGDVIERDYTGAIMLKGGHKIFEKYNWGGRDAIANLTSKTEPYRFVRITATGRRICDTYATCSTVMQELQSNQVNNGISDILWNFVVGGDGNVYVGRGWNFTVENATTMEVGAIGSIPIVELTNTMKEAIGELIDYGVILNEIDADHHLIDEDFQTITNFTWY